MLVLIIIGLIINCIFGKVIWDCAYKKGRQDQALYPWKNWK